MSNLTNASVDEVLTAHDAGGVAVLPALNLQQTTSPSVSDLIAEGVELLLKYASGPLSPINVEAFIYHFNLINTAVASADSALPRNGGAALIAMHLALRLNASDLIVKELAHACAKLGFADKVRDIISKQSSEASHLKELLALYPELQGEADKGKT